LETVIYIPLISIPGMTIGTIILYLIIPDVFFFTFSPLLSKLKGFPTYWLVYFIGLIWETVFVTHAVAVPLWIVMYCQLYMMLVSQSLKQSR